MAQKEKTSMSQKLQKFGSVLAGMVIPNIGAFIGFGLITAFFLETGWTPNEKLANLITPILNYLLPILIGYTGGKMFGDQRGGVIGAFVTMGTIVAVDGTPMFLGAMILGPLSGAIIKRFDKAIDGKVPAGFEMIVNNFSLGIIGGILCCLAYLIVGPVMEAITAFLTSGVNIIIEHHVLPLSAIFVEPAKVLFLNNALDHGIFGPIGYEQVKTLGHSALFMLVPNPGAGLGLLLAYWVFGKGEMKEAAPGMILIHFFGGIHEVYFPYVLSNPLTILGMIAGGMVGTGTLTVLNAGTVATPSPGSIFSVLALAPKDCMIGVILSVVLSCGVSFVINAVIVKLTATEDATLGASVIPEEAAGKSANAVQYDPSQGVAGLTLSGVKKIVVACDAGMGSSAMSAAALRKKVKAENLPIEVINTAIANIPADADLVITHLELTGTAKAAQPNKQHLSITNYLKAPEYDLLVERLKVAAQGQTPVELGETSPLAVKKIVFACEAGKGSSTMGATKFSNRLKAGRPDILIENSAVDNIPADCDIVVVQPELLEHARTSAPKATFVAVENMLADPKLDDLFMQLTTGDAPVAELSVDEAVAMAAQNNEVINKNGVKLNLPSVTKEEAIRRAGELLVEQGCVEPSYIDAMLDREKLITTYMGMGLAIPHGTSQAKGTVKKTGIVFTQYPDGVPFGDEKAQLVIGIAGVGDEHIEMLGKIANALDDEEVLNKMKTTDDIDWIMDILK